MRVLLRLTFGKSSSPHDLAKAQLRQGVFLDNLGRY